MSWIGIFRARAPTAMAVFFSLCPGASAIRKLSLLRLIFYSVFMDRQAASMYIRSQYVYIGKVCEHAERKRGHLDRYHALIHVFNRTVTGTWSKRIRSEHLKTLLLIWTKILS